MLCSSCISLGNIRNRNESSVRYIILFVVMISKICVWYSYTLPYPMIYALDEHMGNDKNYEFYYGLLFSLTSFPKIFLPLIYPLLGKKYGPVYFGFVFSVLIFIGSVFFAVGVAKKSWYVMLIGRFVFGVGLMYSLKTIVAVYFIGKEMALAFSLVVSASYTGMAISNMATVSIVEKDGADVVVAAWMGANLTGISTVLLFVAYLIDLSVERQVKITTKGSESLDPADSNKEIEKASLMSMYQNFSSLPKIFWVLSLLIFLANAVMLPFSNVAQAILLERDYFIEPPSSCTLLSPGCQSSMNYPVNCPNGRWYQPPLPYNVTIGGMSYDQVTRNDIDCSEDLWSGSGACTYDWCRALFDGKAEGALVTSFPFIVAAVISPFIGIFVDKVGWRAILNVLATGGYTIIYFLLGYSPSTPPTGPFIFMGFVNSIFHNSIWPVVPLLVPMKHCGLAIGIMNSVSTLAMTVVPLVVPILYLSSDEKYIPNVLLFFGVVSLSSTFVAIYWNYVDYNTGLLCNSSEKGVGNSSFVGEPEDFFGTGSSIKRPEYFRKTDDLGTVSSILHMKGTHEKESELAPRHI